MKPICLCFSLPSSFINPDVCQSVGWSVYDNSKKVPLGDCDSPDAVASDDSESEEQLMTINISFIGGRNWFILAANFLVCASVYQSLLHTFIRAAVLSSCTILHGHITVYSRAGGSCRCSSDTHYSQSLQAVTTPPPIGNIAICC